MAGKKAPTSDAAGCLNQLWQHMELHLRNRVEAKTGRSTSLELNKLSNLMSHAGLVHPSAVYTAVPTAITTNKRQDASGITISAEQKSALRDVFIKYASWGAKHNYSYMSSSQFVRCCRDTQLVTEDLDTVDLSLMFTKLESSQPAPGGRITFTDWLLLLQLIALTLWPHMAAQQAWHTLVNEHVLMYNSHDDSSADSMAHIILQPEFIQELTQAKAKLRPVFEAYVQQQATTTPTVRQRRPQPTVAAQIATLTRPLSPRQSDDQKKQVVGKVCQPHAQLGNGNNKQSDDGAGNQAQPLEVMTSRSSGLQSFNSMKQAHSSGGSSNTPRSSPLCKNRMALATFLRFLQDFDILPQLISKAEASTCFRAAKFGPASKEELHEATTDVAQIDWLEFLEAVGRCALVAFNFQLPAAPEPVLVLAGYHPAAKAMWSEAAQQELHDSIQYPDEMQMPDTVRSSSTGTEDSPHHDQQVLSRGLADATRSCCVSRAGGLFRSARSLAEYKVRQVVSGGKDAEVLALHDAPLPELVASRPLHLAKYNADWVGLPPLPMSETAGLQTSWSTMTDELQGHKLQLRMEQARAFREQYMEQLHILSQLQKRDVQRQQHLDMKRNRQHMQVRSGQCVIDNRHVQPDNSSGSLLIALAATAGNRQ